MQKMPISYSSGINSSVAVRRLLIISFDIIRKGDSSTSLAVGSCLAHLKSSLQYGGLFVAQHVCVNLKTYGGNASVSCINRELHSEGVDLSTYTDIALSAYVWSEYLINPLIEYFRKEYGFRGNIILGGYQISYDSIELLQKHYPDCQYYIRGYAEEALLRIMQRQCPPGIVEQTTDIEHLASPYLTHTIPVSFQQSMVRMETKRGCPYKCNFCAHRDLFKGKTHHCNKQRVMQELAFFHKQEVQKINVLDPIFNAGSAYIPVMEEMVRLGLQAKVSLQCRFEAIAGERGKRFLELCEKLNVQLEFGLQTALLEESKLVDRSNNISKVMASMKKLNMREIPYEISLIYGLPTQTLESFRQSIDFVIENGCENITAFPLMLLKGTRLFDLKEQYSFKEEAVGEYNIPVVTSSNSFSREEWEEMGRLASLLPSKKSYFRI